MKRILITGGLGFIGSHLVDALIDQGDCNIVVMDNLSSESSSKQYMRNDVEYWIDDVCNICHEKYSVSPFDEIYHLAAYARIQPSFNNPFETFYGNAVGTNCVLEYARKAGTSKVVYAGSSTAYAGQSLNPYALAKYTGEQLCEMYARVYGIDISIARFFNVYGDRQPSVGKYATVIGIFQRQKLENQPLTVTGDGSQRRDFTHVSDIVRGLIAMSKPEPKCQVVNLGTGVNYSILEVAAMFEPSSISFIQKRRGEAETTLADIGFARFNYGWEPFVTLPKYIRDFIKAQKLEQEHEQ